MAIPLLPWNQSQNNTEADSLYLTDSQRLNGLASGDKLPSTLLNKLLYQVGVLLDAIQQFWTFKGLTCDDGPNTLYNLLINSLNTGQDQQFHTVSMSADPSPALDARRYGQWGFALSGWKNFQISLNANAVSPSITGFSVGDEITFVIAQSGGFTWTWPSVVLGGGTVSSGSGSFTVQQFKACDDGKLRAISAQVVS